MEIISRVARWWLKRSAEPALWTLNIGYKRDAALKSEDAYNKVGWVYRCVRAIATNIAQVPVYPVERVGGRGKNQLRRLPDNHPLSMLLRQPNEEQDFSELVESCQTHLHLRGEALWEIESAKPEDPKSMPLRLYNHVPQWLEDIEIDPKTRGYKLFKVRIGAQAYIIPGHNGIFFKFYNPAGTIRGLAPLKAAYQAADADYAVQLYNGHFFDNGAVPSLAVTFDAASGITRLTTEQRERIREEVRRLHSGLDNAHSVMVLGPGEDVKPIGIALGKDMDFQALRKFNKAEIMAVFGVPPILLADVENANRANSVEQRRMFWEETAAPLIDDMQSMLNRRLAPRYGDRYQIVFDISAVPAMRKDLKALGDSVLPMIASGVLTINEVRTEQLNKPPVPWGDEWWHLGTDVPTGTPGEDADQLRGLISEATAKRLLGEWKNASLSRINEGAKSPIEIFPAAHEAKKAARKYNLPQSAAYALACHVYRELALNLNEDALADSVVEYFEHVTKKLVSGEAKEIEGEKPSEK